MIFNLTQLKRVHSEAHIKQNSTVLRILADIDSFDYYVNRAKEALTTAQNGRDIKTVSENLLLATQLCTIARTYAINMANIKSVEETLIPLMTEEAKKRGWIVHGEPTGTSEVREPASTTRIENPSRDS